MSPSESATVSIDEKTTDRRQPKAKKKKKNGDDLECDNPQNTNLNETLWNSRYIASGLKSNLHGDMFQLKHLMLILHRARVQKLSFTLATEMDSAESFDDLVFMYTARTEEANKTEVTNNNGDTHKTDTKNITKKHRFVQIKHKQEDGKKITLGELLNNDRDFSVKQYFRSWRKIKKHEDFKESKESKDFILCTNVGLSDKLLCASGSRAVELEGSDDFLKILNSNTKRFKLIVEGDDKVKVYKQLKLESDSQQLAEELAKRVRNSKNCTVNLDLRVRILKRYQIALKNNVIDTKNKKFYDNFIECENLSPEVVKFRGIFFTKNSSSNEETEDAIKNRLKNILVNVAANCGELPDSVPSRRELPDDDDVTEDEITKFFEEFTLVVGQPNEVNLGALIKNEVTQYNDFGLLNNNFIGDSFLKHILDWFKAKQGFYFDHEIAKYFFEKAECELSSLITVGLNLAYLAEFNEPHVKFTDKETEQLKEFLGSSNDTSGRILQFVSFEDTVLTAERIYKTVKEMQDFKKNDSFIFMHLKKLLSPKIKDHVVRALRSDLSHNLLVVDCGLNSALEVTDELLILLSGFIKGGKSRKRLILITHDSDRKADRGWQFRRKPSITQLNTIFLERRSDTHQMETSSDIQNCNGVKK